MKQTKWENGEWYNLNFAELDKEGLVDLREHIKSEKDEIEYQLNLYKTKMLHGEPCELDLNAKDSSWFPKASLAFKRRGQAIDRINRLLQKGDVENNKTDFNSIFVDNAKSILEVSEFNLIYNATRKDLEEKLNGRN